MIFRKIFFTLFTLFILTPIVMGYMLKYPHEQTMIVMVVFGGATMIMFLSVFGEILMSIDKKQTKSKNKEDIFDKDFLDSIGFAVTKDDGKCGEAESKRARGKRILSWNREGTNINYFGETIEFGVFVKIKEDAGTRTSFYGLIRSRDQLKLINDLCL